MLPDLLTPPPPPFAPRQYQLDALAGVENYFRNKLGTHPVVVMPTGAGKSVCIAELIRRIMRLDRRIIKITHDQRLIEQNFSALMRVWPESDAGIYCAGLGKKETRNPIIFGSIQSVVNNMEALGPRDYVIIDEIHRLGIDESSQYRRYLDYLFTISPRCRVIGFTATPYRMGQGYLWEGDVKLVDGIAYDVSIKRLVNEGWLCPIRSYQRNGIDTTALTVSQGDFEITAQAEGLLAILPAIADDIVEKSKGRKKTLVFCPNVETAIEMAWQLSQRGLLCEHLTSKRNKDEQSSIIAGFKRGEFPALASVDMITTGFDVPDVDCVAICRATTSPGLFVQIVGRGMRIAEGKQDCLLLDYGNNIRRHGVITNVIPPRKRDARQIKLDEEQNIWESMRHCESCGAVYEPPFPEVCECGEVLIVPRKPNVNEYDTKADDKNPMEEQPVWHDVEWVRYDEHQKEGGFLSVVVEYMVEGYTYPFREWVSVENPRGRMFGEGWWRKNGKEGTQLPQTVAETLALIDAGGVQDCEKIQVQREGKWWRILQRVNKADLGADEGLLL